MVRTDGSLTVKPKPGPQGIPGSVCKQYAYGPEEERTEPEVLLSLSAHFAKDALRDDSGVGHPAGLGQSLLEE